METKLKANTHSKKLMALIVLSNITLMAKKDSMLLSKISEKPVMVDSVDKAVKKALAEALAVDMERDIHTKKSNIYKCPKY